MIRFAPRLLPLTLIGALAAAVPAAAGAAHHGHVHQTARCAVANPRFETYGKLLGSSLKPSRGGTYSGTVTVNQQVGSTPPPDPQPKYGSVTYTLKDAKLAFPSGTGYPPANGDRAYLKGVRTVTYKAATKAKHFQVIHGVHCSYARTKTTIVIHSGHFLAPVPARAALATAGPQAGHKSAHRFRAVTLRGIVVSRNHRAHTFTLADRAGNLVEVKSRRDPLLGRRVKLRARPIGFGRFREISFVDLGGFGGRIPMRGEVTWFSRNGREFVLSSIGDSILIHHDRRLGLLPGFESDVRLLVHVTRDGKVMELALRRGRRHRGITYFHGIVKAVNLHTTIEIRARKIGSGQSAHDAADGAGTVTLTYSTPTITITTDGLGASGATETIPFNEPETSFFFIVADRQAGLLPTVGNSTILAQATADCYKAGLGQPGLGLTDCFTGESGDVFECKYPNPANAPTPCVLAGTGCAGTGQNLTISPFQCMTQVPPPFTYINVPPPVGFLTPEAIALSDDGGNGSCSDNHFAHGDSFAVFGSRNVGC